MTNEAGLALTLKITRMAYIIGIILAFSLLFSGGGLLASFADPNGNESVFTYDALGLLVKAEDAAGGYHEKIDRG